MVFGEKGMIFDENERNLKLLVSKSYPQNFKTLSIKKSKASEKCFTFFLIQFV